MDRGCLVSPNPAGAVVATDFADLINGQRTFLLDALNRLPHR
jgi:hypothetical protein